MKKKKKGLLAFSTILDLSYQSTLLNILLTVCLPCANLPDIQSSSLSGEATSVPIKQLSMNFPFLFPVDKLHPSRRNLGPGASRGQPEPAAARGGFKVGSTLPLGLASAFGTILLYTNLKVLKRKISSPGNLITWILIEAKLEAKGKRKMHLLFKLGSLSRNEGSMSWAVAVLIAKLIFHFF